MATGKENASEERGLTVSHSRGRVELSNEGASRLKAASRPPIPLLPFLRGPGYSRPATLLLILFRGGCLRPLSLVFFVVFFAMEYAFPIESIKIRDLIGLYGRLSKAAILSCCRCRRTFLRFFSIPPFFFFFFFFQVSFPPPKQ